MTKKTTKTEEEKSLYDILFDPENDDVITLFNENNEKNDFEQVAMIPFKDQFYAILCPVAEDGKKENDEVFVFLIDEDEDGDCMLLLEENLETAAKVFEEFQKLIKDEIDESNSTSPFKK